MLDNEQQLEQIEIDINDAKDKVAKMEALFRLTQNKDFKAIVDDGYFVQEASRLVLLKADYEMQKEEHQTRIANAITGIGEFRSYLRTIIQVGRMAQDSLANCEETREEILAEVE